MTSINPPPRTDLPYFAYGTLKPDQLGYHLVEDLVAESPIPATIAGELLEQDGLPVLVDGTYDVEGFVLRFSDSEEAYDQISDYESNRNYEWDTTTAETQEGDIEVNVLRATAPNRGRVEPIGSEWTIDQDPLFSEALDIVEDVKYTVSETVNEKSDLEKFFMLQMAYLLLWSSIERYNAFRFGLSTHSAEAREQLANLDSFQNGLADEIPDYRVGTSIFSADLDKSYVLDPDDPEETIEYYYQVRSNVTHRGKSSHEDYRLMHDSLDELYTIFRDHVLAQH